MRVFVCDQEVITKCSTLYWEGVWGCGLGELAGSCGVLFLRKQVRDLRVQEFLRELVVGVATPNNLARSIIVEILHCSEGRDVEQVARISKQISRICECLSLPLSLVFKYLACFYCLHSHMLDILVLYWYTCLDCFNILHALVLIISLHAWYCYCACMHTCIKPRELT